MAPSPNITSLMYIPTSMEEKKRIYKQCKDDSLFFIENYAIIVSKSKKTLFKLYEFQKPILYELTVKNSKVIINKARQLGLSTLMAAIIAWMLLFKSNQEIVVISEKDSKAKELMRKVKIILENVPKFLSLEAIVWNEHTVRLENNSACNSEARSPNAARSATLTFLVIDEAAFIPENIALQIYDSALPTLDTTNGHMCILSTPKGLGGWYYSMWDGAQTGTNSFLPIFLHWNLHPERNEEWKLEKIRDMNNNVKKFEQEYEGNFVSAGETLIDTQWLLDNTKDTITDPLFKIGPNNNIWIWKEPEPNELYLITGDPSRGDSNDFHAMHVIELKSLETCAEFRGKCSTSEFAKIIYDYSKLYNNAGVSVENNGVGWAVIQELLRLGQVNMIYTRGQRVLIDPNKTKQQFAHGKLVPGFGMSASTRPLCLEVMQRFILDGSFPIRSIRLVSEFKTFAWKGGRYEAMDNNCHDDLILSLAQWFYVYEIYVLSKERAKQKFQAMVSAMSVRKSDQNELQNSKAPSFAEFVQQQENNANNNHQNQPGKRALALYKEKYIRKIGGVKSIDFDQSIYLK